MTEKIWNQKKSGTDVRSKPGRPAGRPQPQKFSGPMAKQHRMALLTAGAVAACFLPLYQAQWLFLIILWVITLGALWTTVRRTRILMADLRKEHKG